MTYKEYVPTEMKNPAARDEQLHRSVCLAGTLTGKQIFKTDVADKRAERKLFFVSGGRLSVKQKLKRRSDLNCSAAEIFVYPVRYRKDRASLRRASQRFKHTCFGFGIEIGGDLVKQQHSRIRRRGTGNGKKLPLALA